MELRGYILFSALTFQKENDLVFDPPGTRFRICLKSFAFSVYGLNVYRY